MKEALDAVMGGASNGVIWLPTYALIVHYSAWAKRQVPPVLSTTNRAEVVAFLTLHRIRHTPANGVDLGSLFKANLSSIRSPCSL